MAAAPALPRVDSLKSKAKPGTGPSLDDAIALLRPTVTNALNYKSSGSDASMYNGLLARLDALCAVPCPPEVPFLLRALAQCVSLISERPHERLLGKLFAVNLWVCADEITSPLVDLMLALVSAQAGCLCSVLEMLVRNFTPPRMGPGAGPPPTPAAEARVLGAVHTALERLLVLVPLAPAALLPVLLRRLPHRRIDVSTQLLVLRSVWRIAEGPGGLALRDGVLLGVLDKLLELDLEVRWEELVDAGGVAEEVGDAEEEAIFELDELELGAATGAEGHEGEAAERAGADGAGGRPSPSAPVDETVDKLDRLMASTFGHLARRCAGGDLHGALLALLRGFDAAILPAYRAKFTQFLLFYVCCARPEDPHGRCAAALIELLLSRMEDGGRTPAIRVAAAAYLASFTARAAPLPHPLVAAVVSRLAAVAATPDAPPQLLAGVVQALLYVLCYRLPALAASPEGVPAVALNALPLAQLATAPPPGCNPAVLAEFARQAASLRLLAPEVSAALQSSAAAATEQRAAEAAALAAAGGAPLPSLELFFPFDPYLLRRSAAYLELRRTYRRWQGGGGAADVAGGTGPGGDAGAREDGDDGDGDDDDDDDVSDSDEEDGSDAPSTSSDEEGEHSMDTRSRGSGLPRGGSMGTGSYDCGSLEARSLDAHMLMPPPPPAPGLARPAPIGAAGGLRRAGGPAPVASGWPIAVGSLGPSTYDSHGSGAALLQAGRSGSTTPSELGAAATGGTPMSMTPDVGNGFLAMARLGAAGRPPTGFHPHGLGSLGHSLLGPG